MANSKTNTASPIAQYIEKRLGRAALSPLNALDHIAFAILLEDGATVKTALEMVASLKKDFFDWNEIRVSRTQEVARTLSAIIRADTSARRLIEEYNGFFEKKGCLSFDFLRVVKVAEAKKQLHQAFPLLHKGAISLILYEFCPEASLPISDAALKLARKEGLIGKSANREQFVAALASGAVPGDAVLLVQHLELEVHGNPYGEVPPPPAKKKLCKPEDNGGKRPGKDPIKEEKEMVKETKKDSKKAGVKVVKSASKAATKPVKKATPAKPVKKTTAAKAVKKPAAKKATKPAAKVAKKAPAKKVVTKKAPASKAKK
ncbi:MAG: hypothetical protein LBU79_07375 [Planctomycetota bacterium]|jgi:hypothetical protein|nr:hypothetical protein [Planctomycetota bacterium]